MSGRFGSKRGYRDCRRQQQIVTLHELPHLGPQKTPAKIERMQIGCSDLTAKFSLGLKIRIRKPLLRTAETVINLTGRGKP